MQLQTEARVASEIGFLNKVIVHRPGKELLHIYPTFLEEMLFSEIPWLEGARKEHEQFTSILKKEGVSVLFLDDLMKEILSYENIRLKFIEDNIEISNVIEPFTKEAIYNYLESLTLEQTIEAFISGLNKNFVQSYKRRKSLSDFTRHTFPFYIPPLPSMYFTRDQAVMFGENMIFSSMVYQARKRESIFIKYLQMYHSLFSYNDKSLDISLPKGLEGGDILVLSKNTIIIGLSQRTTEEAVEKAAYHLLIQEEICKEILVVQIPFKKQYLHLDMVLNQVDVDKFLFYPVIMDKTYCYRLTARKEHDYKYVYSEKMPSLQKALEDSLKIPIQIIYSGGGNNLTASREQQNGANNILTISPGKVVAFNRNEITNEILAKNGIKILEFDGSELIRGMGGPRCMSMPVLRQEV